jgi:hypothetical protein
MNKCLERVNDRHFWNPGVISYAIIPSVTPTQSFFFFPFIVTSVVYVYGNDTDYRYKNVSKGQSWSRTIFYMDRALYNVQFDYH